MNYVFFAASLGLVALGVSAMLAYRLLRAGQQRAVVQGNTVLSASAAVVWLSVLLPISACFLVPLLSSFPLVYPPTGSFHIANLLPDREAMAYLSLQMGDPAPETPQPGWGGPGGTFEWVTFDTVLTLGLAVYLVFSATGRLRRSPYGHLLVMAICVTSTFVAHSATLSPVTWGRGAWLYCAMVFPALYTLLFDSKEDCRKPGSFFGLAVVNAVAITTLGVLSVSADSFLEDTNALDSTVFGYAREFGASFYVYPMAIMFVVLALTRWRLTRPNNVPRAEST